MGGRGSSSKTASAGRGVAAPSQQPAQQTPTPAQQQSTTVPTQTANQPTLTLGATTDMATIQAMTPTQFAKYVSGQQNAQNPMSAVLYDSPVQRMIYDTGLNGKPEVVSESQFSKMPGQTLYRTVNAVYDSTHDVNHPADQIARQTMQSGFNRIGGGIHGDGHYFDTSRRGSTIYGNTRGDMSKTAVMQAKLNGNAKVITKAALQRMLANEPKSVQTAMHRINRKSPTYASRDNNLSAYALYKGYNVIQVSGPTGYHVVIDRSALTFSQKITAK